MTYKDLGALTDPLEAVKSLFAEMTSIKEELSATKSDVARLNRNNTKLVVENRNFKTELAQTKEELARLKSNAPVEKDSTNSSIPPTKQSIAKQIIQHTTSLRKPSGKKPGAKRGMRATRLRRTALRTGLLSIRRKHVPIADIQFRKIPNKCASKPYRG